MAAFRYCEIHAVYRKQCVSYITENNSRKLSYVEVYGLIDSDITDVGAVIGIES